MEPHTRSRIKDSLSNYLTDRRWQWNWVLTQTFDPSKPSLTYWHETRKERLFRTGLVLHSWNKVLAEIALRTWMVYGFVFGEQHKNGNPHWHALLHVRENAFKAVRRTSIHKWCLEEFGRNRITPMASENLEVRVDHMSDGISRYLTKYVAKEADGDHATWDFGGFLNGSKAETKQITDRVGIKPSDFALK